MTITNDTFFNINSSHRCLLIGLIFKMPNKSDLYIVKTDIGPIKSCLMKLLHKFIKLEHCTYLVIFQIVNTLALIISEYISFPQSIAVCGI